MGACGTRTQSVERRRTNRIDVEPSDTDSLKGLNLPTLDFYVLLSEIKIKKCDMEAIGLRFRINGVEEYVCPSKQLDNTRKAYWHINHPFDFMMNEYQFRKKFLVVEAVNRKKEVVGALKLNMYSIWIGPFHLDFSMDLKGGSSCRISFNLRISQGIHFKLENTASEIIPLQPLVEGSRLTFTMEAIIGQKTEPSNYAYDICIEKNKDHNNSKGLLGNFPMAPVVSKNCIKWEKMLERAELPHFNEKIAYYEIYSSSLHFVFWEIFPGAIIPSEPRFETIGQCFIPISKLLSADFSIYKDPVSSITYLKRTIELTQKVWLHGKDAGKAKFNFNFLVQSHQKQMQSCVRTEEGILTSTPVFSDSRAEQCQEIASLNNLNTSIQKEFITLDETVEKTHNYVLLKEIVKRIFSLLERVLGLLEKTSKESILMYNYRNEMELMKGQKFLIDFARKTLSYIHEDIADLNDICWTILTTILRRGEFKLSHMAFSKTDKQQLAKHQMNDNLNMKIDVGLKYMELLNQLLKQTLKCLEIKGQTAEQIFAQKFCSYAYFRLPHFREHILQAIKQGNDPQIPQWRGTEINLYEDNSTQDYGVSDGFYENLFDWEHNFYKPLSGEQKFRHIAMTFQNTLIEDRWKLRLSHRRGAFFTFLQNLVKQIEYVSVVSKHIKWHYLPGYNRLLHAFLFEMKNTKIISYSERFKKCSIQLLLNQKLLNVFIVLLLKKSNVNDPQTVSIAFEMIDQFFKALKRKNRPIPGTFDYKFLLMGIKTVLQSQFQMSISQVLLFIFDNFKVFSQQFSLQLSLYLMNKMFYRFFFHWSFNLREMFHMLVYIKIGRFQKISMDYTPVRGRELTPSDYISGLKNSLRHRYQSLLETIKDDIEPQLPKSDRNDTYLEKDLFKKMKSKLSNKRYQAIKKVRDNKNKIELPSLMSTNSLDQCNTSKYSTPKKLLFFKDEETQIEDVQPQHLGYVKISLSQYNAIIQEMKPILDKDPSYCPDMSIKKLRDELELSPQNLEEW